MPYANRALALRRERRDSEFYPSLSGQWKFNWARKPAERPTTFFEPDFDDSGWGLITVPGPIEMQMQMPDEFAHVQWCGRGPHETYWDRQSAAAVGVYAMKAKELAFDTIRPQENGNRTDVRPVAFYDDEGTGFAAIGSPLMNFSAWPYTQAQLAAATHTVDLPAAR